METDITYCAFNAGEDLAEQKEINKPVTPPFLTPVATWEYISVELVESVLCFDVKNYNKQHES